MMKRILSSPLVYPFGMAMCMVSGWNIRQHLAIAIPAGIVGFGLIGIHSWKRP